MTCDGCGNSDARHEATLTDRDGGILAGFCDACRVWVSELGTARGPGLCVFCGDDRENTIRAEALIGNGAWDVDAPVCDSCRKRVLVDRPLVDGRPQ